MIGCATVSTQLDRLPEFKPVAQKQPQGQPPLATATGQEFQIALQTAELAEQRGMDAEAIAAFEKVRKLRPHHPGVAHALAVLYDRGAMTDAAQREYKAALAESPEDANVLCDYGYFLYCIGDVKQAEERLRQCLENNAAHPQGTTNLAVVLASVQQYEEAQTLFERATGPAAALHNIGLFKLRHGQTDEGKRMIAAAQKQDPSLSRPNSVLTQIADASIPSFGTSEATGTMK